MQGFNMGRYVPPDAEGVLTANQASGKGHALGTRASRLKSQGILTVRFEMPFAVWCDTCEGGGGGQNSTQNNNKKPQPVLIGQGVRFNAEKKKIGSYFSSPIYSFRMRHAPCGGLLEIHTDPKNTAYVVAAGGRKRDTGETSSHQQDDASLLPSSLTGPVGPILTPHEQAHQRESAFAHLEKTIADRAALAAAGQRIDAIGEVSARQWDDPYARNQALRRTFRAGRRQREREAARTGHLRERMGGLGIDLLPESEDDTRRARLVEFGRAPPSPDDDGDGKEGGGGGGGGGGGKNNRAAEAEKVVFAKPLFDNGSNDGGASNRKKPPPPKKLKSELVASKRKESLVSEIMGNTRMASDPFLEPRSSSRSSSREAITKTAGSGAASTTVGGGGGGGGTPLLPGLKRKRDVGKKEPSPTTTGNEHHEPPEKVTIVSSSLLSSAGLVDYDSD